MVFVPKHFKRLLFVSSGLALLFLLFYVEFFSTEDWIIYEAQCDAVSNDHHNHHQTHLSDFADASLPIAARSLPLTAPVQSRSSLRIAGSEGAKAGGGGGGGGGGVKEPVVVNNHTMRYHFDLYRIRVHGCCCPPYANRTELPLCCDDCERNVNYTDCVEGFCEDLSMLGIVTVVCAFCIVLFGLVSLLFTFARLRLIHQKDIFFPVRGLFWMIAALISVGVWVGWETSGEDKARDYLESCHFPGSFIVEKDFRSSRNSKVLIFSFSFCFFMAAMNQLLATRPKYAVDNQLTAPIIHDRPSSVRLQFSETQSVEDVDGEEVRISGENVVTFGG